MKRISQILCISLVLALFCLGCAPTNIATIQDKWGPPAEVVQKGEFTVYYYYKDYGQGIHSYGWRCTELTCDKDGKIIKKREYWKQPKFN